MQLLPAIDIRGGQCVRLQQGDYNRETVFDAEPASVARRWVEQGATYLHLVDLDGARIGRPVNGQAVRAIVQTVGVPCQLGGGLRTEADIEEALSWGVQRVILGTRAVQDPAWLRDVSYRLPGRIVLGLDARDGLLATEGWLTVSDRSALAVARDCAEWPLAAIVYTDIRKDGMLAGPNLDGLAEMASAVSLPVIASGGVTSLDDIAALVKLRLAGCIIGRALYEGRLSLPAALAVCSGAAAGNGLSR